MTNEKLFYIQNGWVGNACLWWAIDSKGYTTDIRKAGKYTQQQTIGIITRPQDVAWECDYVDNCLDAQRLVVDGNCLDNDKCLLGERR